MFLCLFVKAIKANGNNDPMTRLIFCSNDQIPLQGIFYQGLCY